jgi:hypothetical protein
MNDKVKVHASCGYYTGESKWIRGLSDWYKEPDDCNWEDIIEVDKEEWEEGFVSIKCPKCNAELTQDMDHFEEVK